jgi:hypothetical protein
LAIIDFYKANKQDGTGSIPSDCIFNFAGLRNMATNNAIKEIRLGQPIKLLHNIKMNKNQANKPFH